MLFISLPTFGKPMTDDYLTQFKQLKDAQNKLKSYTCTYTSEQKRNVNYGLFDTNSITILKFDIAFDSGKSKFSREYISGTDDKKPISKKEFEKKQKEVNSQIGFDASNRWEMDPMNPNWDITLDSIDSETSTNIAFKTTIKRKDAKREETAIFTFDKKTFAPLIFVVTHDEKIGNISHSKETIHYTKVGQFYVITKKITEVTGSKIGIKAKFNTTLTVSNYQFK